MLKRSGSPNSWMNITAHPRTNDVASVTACLREGRLPFRSGVFTHDPPVWQRCQSHWGWLTVFDALRRRGGKRGNGGLDVGQGGLNGIESLFDLIKAGVGNLGDFSARADG